MGAGVVLWRISPEEKVLTRNSCLGLSSEFLGTDKEDKMKQKVVSFVNS